MKYGPLACLLPILLSLPSASISDQPLADFRRELLDLAFQSATALPVQPHIKDRSRAQEAVVAACLELGQPLRALGNIEKIDNWRQGAGYADLAFYLAQHGAVADVQPYLDLAGQIAEKQDGETSQDWQRDRIRAKIARTHTLLGQSGQAAEFEETVKAVDGIVAKGDFDQVRNALEACAQLFDRFFDDAARRAAVEAKIKSSWQKLPILIRLELMMELVGFALGHQDQHKALELVNETSVLLEGAGLGPDYRIPLIARLAGLRFRAGDQLLARSEADSALALFDLERGKIVDIDRAGVLRPLAEMYQTMGETAVALAVYRRAVEAGVENPNSRPRAEDLSATCCSMAVHGVEPDPALRARMQKIAGALAPPW